MGKSIPHKSIKHAIKIKCSLPNVTHLGHRCVITALMNLGPGSMPRVGSSGQNLEHNLKNMCIHIHVVYNYASFSCIFII